MCDFFVGMWIYIDKYIGYNTGGKYSISIWAWHIDIGESVRCRFSIFIYRVISSYHKITALVYWKAPKTEIPPIAERKFHLLIKKKEMNSYVIYVQMQMKAVRSN
jgi:hypothetical protein